MPRFIVNGSWVELGAMLQPPQIVELLEGAVLPSLDMLRAWEEEGRVSGGVFVGEREATFVLDADSAESASLMLSELPFWGMMKWNVRPIHSFGVAAERERAGMARFQEAGGSTIWRGRRSRR